MVILLVWLSNSNEWWEGLEVVKLTCCQREEGWRWLRLDLLLPKTLPACCVSLFLWHSSCICCCLCAHLCAWFSLSCLWISACENMVQRRFLISLIGYNWKGFRTILLNNERDWGQSLDEFSKGNGAWNTGSRMIGFRQGGMRLFGSFESVDGELVVLFNLSFYNYNAGNQFLEQIVAFPLMLLGFLKAWRSSYCCWRRSFPWSIRSSNLPNPVLKGIKGFLSRDGIGVKWINEVWRISIVQCSGYDGCGSWSFNELWRFGFECTVHPSPDVPWMFNAFSSCLEIGEKSQECVL